MLLVEGFIVGVLVILLLIVIALIQLGSWIREIAERTVQLDTDIGAHGHPYPDTYPSTKYGELGAPPSVNDN